VGYLSALSAQRSSPQLFNRPGSGQVPVPALLTPITFILRLRAGYKRRKFQREQSRVYSRTGLWWAANNALEVEVGVEAAASGAESSIAAVGEDVEVVARAEDVMLVIRQYLKSMVIASRLSVRPVLLAIL
jgi:hypothetical protein